MSLEVSLGSRLRRQRAIGESVLILALWTRENRSRAIEGSA